MTDFAPPSEDFLRELREVAKKAADLSNYIGSANRLPKDFQTESVQSICSALLALPNASANEAIETLIYTNKRLYVFRPRPTEDEALETEEIARGEALDQKIASVHLSVVTAIGAYEDDYGIDVVEPEIKEKSISKTEQDDFGASDVAKSAGEARKQIADLVEDLRARGFDDNAIAAIVRGSVDTQVGLLLSEAELSLRSPKQLWLEKIAGQVLISAENLGKALEQAPKVGNPAVKAWYELKAMFWTSALEAVGIVGKATREVAEKLRLAIESKNKIAPVEDPPFDLEKAHEMILDGEDLYQSWKPQVSSLRFVGIRDFGDKHFLAIEKLTNLKYLNLDGTGVTDIKAVEKLTNLKTLDLEGTGVTDIKAIEKLTNLEFLNLDGTGVTDIKAVEKLTNLELLDLSGTDVGDVSALRYHKALTHIWISADQTQLESAIKANLPNVKIMLAA